MVTIFDKFGELLSIRLFGIIPVWFIFLIGVVGIVFYLIITRKPKGKEYKAINLKREIKNDLDVNYKYFSSKVQKPIYNGMNKIGIVAGYMPLIWQKREYFKLLKKKIKGKINIVKIKISEQQARRTRSKIETIDKITNLIALKIYSIGIINKVKAMFGFGFRYFIFKKDDINLDGNAINISSELQRQYFFGQFIFSRASKSLIDNTSFRIDRENQLQEIANQIPRTVFFDTEMAKQVSRYREVAEIERRKYQAQKESMQD